MHKTPPPAFALGKRNCCPICVKPYREVEMVECTQCRKWIHYECAKVDDSVMEDQFWKCSICQTYATDCQPKAARSEARALSVSTRSSKLSDAQAIQMETINAQLKNLQAERRLLEDKEKLAKSIIEEETRANHDLGTGAMSSEEVVQNYLSRMPVQHSPPGQPGVTLVNIDVGEALSGPKVVPELGVQGDTHIVSTTSTPTSMAQPRQRDDTSRHEEFLRRHSKYRVTAHNTTNVTNAVRVPLVSTSTTSGAIPIDYGEQKFDGYGYWMPSTSTAEHVPLSTPQTNYNDAKNQGAIPKSTHIPSQPVIQQSQPVSDASIPMQPQVSQPQTGNNPVVDLSNFQRLAMRQTTAKELPAFSGKPEEWPIFISAYNYTISEAKYTNVENMIRLSNSLKGKAREVVAPMLTLPNCVPRVIETLRLYFGRPTVLIEHYISKVREMPSPKPDKLETLFDFAIAIQNLCMTMQQAEQTNHMTNPMLLKQLVEKLPPMIKMNWAIHKRTAKAGESLQALSDFLKTICTDLCDVGLSLDLTQVEKQTNKHKPANQNTSRQTKGNNESLYVHDHTKPICISCNESCQGLTECDKFKQLPLREKWDAVKKNRLYNRCLKKHGGKCEKSVACKVEGCDKKYHPILHKHDNLENDDAIVTNVNHHLSGKKVMFRIMPVVLFNGSKAIKTFAFLDEGSSSSLITEEIRQKLQIQGTKEPFRMRWTGNISTTEKESQKIDLEISGVQPGAAKMKLDQVRSVKALNLPRQSLNYAEMSRTYDYLYNLPIESYTDASPQLLIGLMNWKVAVPTRSKFDGGEGPIAIKCRLGWTICAGSTNPETEVQSYHICESQPKDGKNNDELAEKDFSMHNLEITGPKKVPKMEAKQIDEVTGTSRKRDCYRKRLPWRHDHRNLPKGKPIAVPRSRCHVQESSSDPQLQQMVQGQTRNYLTKGKPFRTEILKDRIPTKYNSDAGTKFGSTKWPLKNNSKQPKIRGVSNKFTGSGLVRKFNPTIVPTYDNRWKKVVTKNLPDRNGSSRCFITATPIKKDDTVFIIDKKRTKCLPSGKLAKFHHRTNNEGRNVIKEIIDQPTSKLPTVKIKRKRVKGSNARVDPFTGGQYVKKSSSYLEYRIE